MIFSKEVSAMTFSKGELQSALAAYQTGFGVCSAIYCDWDCKECPLDGLKPEAAIAYIMQHLEEAPTPSMDEVSFDSLLKTSEEGGDD